MSMWCSQPIQAPASLSWTIQWVFRALYYNKYIKYFKRLEQCHRFNNHEYTRYTWESPTPAPGPGWLPGNSEVTKNHPIRYAPSKDKICHPILFGNSYKYHCRLLMQHFRIANSMPPKKWNNYQDPPNPHKSRSIQWTPNTVSTPWIPWIQSNILINQ